MTILLYSNSTKVCFLRDPLNFWTDANSRSALKITCSLFSRQRRFSDRAVENSVCFYNNSRSVTFCAQQQRYDVLEYFRCRRWNFYFIAYFLWRSSCLWNDIYFVKQKLKLKKKSNRVQYEYTVEERNIAWKYTDVETAVGLQRERLRRHIREHVRQISKM